MQTTIEQKLFSLPCQEFYLNIATNPQLLSKGYQIVYKYLSISQLNRQSTLLHLLSDKVPILTLVTRTYPLVYSSQSLTTITNQQRIKTKQYLIIEILFKKLVLNYNKQIWSNKRKLNSFLLFLIHFHNNQGFQGWVPFYQKLLEQLIKINSQLIGYILIEILKNSDDRVSCFSKHILSFIVKNQSNLKISEQESLQIIYYCIKSMAYLNGTDDALLEQYFEPYEEQIIQYIFKFMSKSVKIMKFSLKILTVFTADYEIQLEKDMINKIVECSKQLIVQFVNTRLTSTQSPQDLDQIDQDQQNHTTISVILYQLIELFQTLLSVEQMKMSDYEIYLSICLPSLLLSKGEFLSYSKSTETYLADIEDQAQKTLRNKVISFLLQLYQGEYPSKTKGKMQSELLKYCLLIENCKNQNFNQILIGFYSNLSLKTQIKKQLITLFEESILFLLYHLTQQIITFDQKQLQQNKQSFVVNLGKNIQASDNLIKVSSLNLLNKLIKSMNKNIKSEYYNFLINQSLKISDFQKDKGYVLSICRGIAYVANDVQLSIIERNQGKGIQLLFLQNLIKYLLDSNTVQQSAHLILQFFLTLLKKCSNAKKQLRKLFSSQIQLHILSTFIHDGMISDVVIDLLGQIASQSFVSYIYGQFLKGTAKQQNLSSLISRWIKLSVIYLPETDIKILLGVYKSEFVQKIIKEYLRVVHKQNLSNKISNETISLLNQRIVPSWILPMIGCNLLRNPEALLLKTIQNIAYQLTSQYQIQNHLLLPYYTFLNDPQFGVNLLRSKSIQLYNLFFDKLIRYAALFQGSNLKVMTSLVLLNVCQLDSEKIQGVLQLISSYGNSSNKNMQDEQWEDQNYKDQQQNVIDRMFNMKIVNDQVQKEFLQIFGDKVTDMRLVNAKVQKFIGKN